MVSSHLLSEVVADLDEVLDFGVSSLFAVDVDGKVSIYKLHLVFVAMGNADHHVVDVGAHRSHSSKLLLGAEPLLNLFLNMR